LEIAMYALIETSGRQYRVSPGQKVVVDSIQAEVGAEIVLDRVLLLGAETVVVGAPTIPGASVVARVVDHHRGEKITTFKYVRRRRVRHVRCSRAALTTLEITRIDTATE
jgi:large subunit ribosomal protein L21